MVRFSKDDRVFLADSFRDVANLAAGGMLFGQFVVDHPFFVWIAVAGALAWIGFMVYAVVLRQRED
jgi:hypothetical protein